MNNNRGNNRRRGRGNNNRAQGGGQQLNRIDSRARGNAPQLLEKYRKLAQDAHLNGDRVQAEYYLQFADHYFRVIADTRLRQEEQRARQNGGQGYAGGVGTGSVSGDRWQDADGEDEGAEFGIDADFPGFDRQGYEPRPQFERNFERNERPQQPRRDDRGNRDERGNREDRGNRDYRDQRQRPAEPVAGEPLPPEGVRAAEGEPIAPSSDNPFVRDNRQPRGRNDRGDRRPRRDEARREDGRRDDARRDDGRREGGYRRDDNRRDEPQGEERAAGASLFEAGSLPPAIGPRPEADAPEAHAAPTPASAPVVAETPIEAAPAPRPARAPRGARAAAAKALAEVAAAMAPEAAAAAPESSEAPAPRKRGRPRKTPLAEASAEG